MNAEQFKQVVLLSVPTGNSQGKIKLSAKSSNFGVLLCFAKAMGEINNASGSPKLVLDFDKMKQSDGWHKAEQDFKKTFTGQEFKAVLETYASGQKVDYSNANIYPVHFKSFKNMLGTDALKFLLDQVDLNDRSSLNFKR